MSAIVLLVLRLLLAASLYAFLGFALWTLYRELRRQTEMMTTHQAPALILLPQDGGQTYRFTKPEISVGRDRTCDCILEDQTVSARHARFTFHHNQWWVEDLGSTNGTFLNQDPIHSPLVVTMGDEVRCGQVVMNISIGESNGLERNGHEG